MSNDNLTKGRVAKYINKLKDAGIEAPVEILGIEDWAEKEAALKEFWGIHKPTDKPDDGQFQTDQEAAEAIKSVADERIAALEAMIAKQGEMIQQLAMKDTKEYGMGMMNEAFIPHDDLLERAEVFYVPSDKHNIWGKQIGNTWTPPPMGMKAIKFTRAWGWVTREGSAAKQKRIATYVCKSRTISKWLKTLPEYRRIFFLDLDDAMSASGSLTFAQIHAKHYAALQGRGYQKLTALAGDYGIATTVSRTTDEYANLIAEKMANEEIERSKENFNRAIHAQGVKQMVLGK
jgi:hypothetical protein